MPRIESFLVSFALFGSLVVALSALAPPQQRAVPAASEVTGRDGGPPWHDRRELEGGVVLETHVGFTEHVARIDTGSVVRPVALRLSFLVEERVMSEIDHMDLHEVADAAPLEFRVSVDRNPHTDTEVLEPVEYLVRLSPVPERTWGTIRGAVDLRIEVGKP